MHESRSHKVRTILQLEGRAAAWRARYEGTLARIAPRGIDPSSSASRRWR